MLGFVEAFRRNLRLPLHYACAKIEREEGEERMYRKIVAETALPMLLLLSLFLPSTSAMEQYVYIPNKDHLMVAWSYKPTTLDPHAAHDLASRELIFNIYETLVFFNYERHWEFLPKLATRWVISRDLKTYKFYLRSNVSWHDPAYGTVTPRDIEYSFERGMVQDFTDGPIYKILKPLLNITTTAEYDLSDPIQAERLGHLIDDAVVTVIGIPESFVQFNLAVPYAPDMFLQILSGTWASIMDEEWSTAQGAWPGFDETGYINWRDYNQRYNPLVTPLNTMMGSGPYKYVPVGVVDSWEVQRFADYWGGWPATGVAGYVERATVKYIPNWSDRWNAFLSNDPAIQVDIIDVPLSQAPIPPPGVRVIQDLPTLQMDAALYFNWNVSETSPYPPMLDGVVKLDLLSDPHMRKAIAHSFDYATYISEWWYGEAEQPANPVIHAFGPYYDPNAPKYDYDLAEATAEFQLAWNGSVWSEGFTLYILYNEGNLIRQTIARMLESAIESLNPLFDIVPFGLPWSQFLPAMINRELPAWIVGWIGDPFPNIGDPDELGEGFVTHFMHPFEGMPAFQSIQYSAGNEYVADLIETARKLPTIHERKAVYDELQTIWYDDIPTMLTATRFTWHWERDWVQQWYYNVDYPGLYIYHLWKGLDADTNGDNVINILDAAVLSNYWGPVTTPEARVADIYPNSEMDNSNYTIYGADGLVDISDAAKINAMWHDWTDP